MNISGWPRSHSRSEYTFLYKSRRWAGLFPSLANLRCCLPPALYGGSLWNVCYLHITKHVLFYIPLPGAFILLFVSCCHLLTRREEEACEVHRTTFLSPSDAGDTWDSFPLSIQLLFAWMNVISQSTFGQITHLQSETRHVLVYKHDNDSCIMEKH